MLLLLLGDEKVGGVVLVVLVWLDCDGNMVGVVIMVLVVCVDALLTLAGNGTLLGSGTTIGELEPICCCCCCCKLFGVVVLQFPIDIAVGPCCC